MARIIRLTESDLMRIVKRVINEQDVPKIPRTPGTIAVLDEKQMVDGDYFYVVEKLMGLQHGAAGRPKIKELYGIWKLKEEIDPKGKFNLADIEFYVNNNKVFEDDVVGQPDRMQRDFVKKTGKFRITYVMYNHPEAGPTAMFEIHILK